LNSGVGPEDPTVRNALNYLRGLELDKTYTVSLQTMVLAAAEPKKDMLLIGRNVRWLEEHQIKEGPRKGAWSYPGPGGDNSNAQFAVLALALLPLALNWSWASRADDYTARDWAYNVLMSVEPYGVLFTNGDNDTFPLWYLQEVEGLRQDVTVMVSSYLNTPWYVKQIRGLTTPCPEDTDASEERTRIICQRPFRPEQAPEFYTQSRYALHPPERAAIALSPEEIDSVTEAFAADIYSFYLPSSLQVTADELEFTVPGGGILAPAHFFMLHMIQNAMGDRPIYFASTTAEYQRLGLTDHLIREGVAFRVSDGPIRTVAEDPDTFEDDGGHP
jgi:hypothetical protein